MIVDRLQHAERYAELHGRFAAAFEYLRRPEIGEMANGRYAIDGDDLFVIVERLEGRGRDGARVEYHRQYIDIQFVIDGTEQIGWIPTTDCRSGAQPYDPQRDVGFYADAPATWLSLPSGTFAIFFPEDSHAPLAGSGPVHKAVVKVAVEERR